MSLSSLSGLSSSIRSIADQMRQRMEQMRAQMTAQMTRPATQGKTAPPAPSNVMSRYHQDGFDGPSRTRSSQPMTPSQNPDQVAQKLAREATGYSYDSSGGKTWSQAVGNEDTFDGSKSGVCADMALEAAQRFEQEGVEARVAYGKTARGNHAWVEYKDAQGNWKMFDPTAAACTKRPQDALTPRDNGLYGYGSVFSRYDAPAER
jgi:transglutaminase-like putative cysteine protease